MNEPLLLDFSHLMGQFTDVQLHTLFKKREAAKKKLAEDHASSKVGFLDLPYQKNILDLKSWAKSVVATCDDFVVIGIGGSSLGAKAAIQALSCNSKINIHFLENPNPASVEAILKKINLKKTALNVISKSGSTLETLTLFFIFFEKLKKEIGLPRLKDRIFVTTEMTDNFLHSFSKSNSLRTLFVPENVGGRYSVLSCVGLFPMAVAGLDLPSILAGAKWIDQHRGATYMTAVMAYAAHKILKKSQSVLFLYDERLNAFGDWFCQLWAESLAKTECSGSTPLKAIGALDQHSLLQLFLQGPRDKWFTTLKIESYNSAVKIPESLDLKEYSYLKNIPLEKILHVEQKVTEESLIKFLNPIVRVATPKLNATTLGALFYHFELATAVTGYMYDINPFNQPAVEEGKRLVQEILKNKQF